MLAKDLNNVKLLDLYGSILTSRQRDVAENYYHYDLSLAEIADNLNISRQAVMDALNKAIASLHSFEEKLGFCKKSEKVLGLLDVAERNIKDGDEAAARAAIEKTRRLL